MKRLRIIMIVILAVIGISSILVYLYGQGIVHVNYLNLEKYPIRGVDVSHYQGEIDWEKLASQNVRFAFIKATEGSKYVDPCFHDNWNEAADTGIRVGAYHFFSYESSGKAQAELFCNNVNYMENMLPPVVDVEYYGKYRSADDIDIKNAKKELRELINVLEAEYGTKPIIYSGFLYNALIKNDFEDCDLWYGLVFNPFFNKDKCEFWQYSQNQVLKGYSGSQKFIDMDVFMGSEEEFDKYPSKD